ncbi:MAG TPA: CHC2 zinc finger domain-containing protein [Fimbriimonas sp.]|nr:CHC2 zinc finger domain-containing protein [Fimbriimonas sp.]
MGNELVHFTLNESQIMPSTWIDFKELRAKLDFEKVLRHYGVELKLKGRQHLGLCPLPNHIGDKKALSFSANLDRGIFQCFGCGSSGNSLEFAALMEKASLDNGRAFRAAALRIQKTFCPELVKSRPSKAASNERQLIEQPPLEVVLNSPLDFELKGLERRHPYFEARGLTAETIDYFGLGYCSRGSLKGRIAIPLYDAQGRLIGYSSEEPVAKPSPYPSFSYPAKRQRDGKSLDFDRSLFVYGGHRIKAPVDRLVVVETFPFAWWLHQAGIRPVLATMDANCSDDQADLAVEAVSPEGVAWIVSDSSPSGRQFAQACLARIAQKRLVRWVRLDNYPSELGAEDLRSQVFP